MSAQTARQKDYGQREFLEAEQPSEHWFDRKTCNSYLLPEHPLNDCGHVLTRTRHSAGIGEDRRFAVAEYYVSRTTFSQSILPHVAEILARTLDEDTLLL